MNGPQAPINPFAALQLRCGSCGAAYAGRPEAELLTCGYCGTTQRMVDARQFLDHFMAQVTAFVQQAIPAGIDISHSDTIDPIARLAAFNMGVRPRLSTESDQYRLGCFKLLANSLVVFPFSANRVSPGGPDPTTVSVFAAKVHYVSGLAVDDSSRLLVRRSGGLATCYQSLLVAGRLAGDTQPERFHLIAQNYITASKAIEDTGSWSSLSVRLAALASACQAVDLLLSGGDMNEARRLLGSSGQELSKVRSLLLTTPELGYMTAAVDQELAGVRTIGSMISIAEVSRSVPPSPLVFTQRLCAILDWLSQSAPSDWGVSYRSLNLREEIFRRAAELRAAQAGRGSVKVVGAGSGVLVPFWVVELPYTFETGIAWTKRGREVPESLLVAATFPTDISGLYGRGTARFLTNVFASGGGGHSLNNYFDHIRGREQKISESGGVVPILQTASVASVPGAQAVPPFTTEAEAQRLVEMYVNEVRTANPKVAAQLRASSPRILDLVYLPCILHSSPLVPWLGPLSPSSLGDPQSLLGFVS